MQKRYRLFAQVSQDFAGLLATSLAAAIPFLAILGYLLGIPAFTSFNPSWTHMRMITAFCLLVSAAALALLRKETPGRRAAAWARAFGATVCAVGLLTFAGYLFEFGTGRNPPLYHTLIVSQFLATGPRMAVITAALFALYGVVLLLFSLGSRRADGIAHLLLIGLSLVVYLVILGYLFDIPALYLRMNLGIAFNTDIAFLCLCFAGFCFRPRTWFISVFMSDQAGGAMGRRLLPWLLALPPAIGWLRITGERAGLIESPLGVALVAVTYTVCFLWILWFTARAVNRTDLFRRKAEEGLAFQAHLLANVHDAVIGLDAGYAINYWNESAQKMYGWSSAEALGKKSFEILHTEYIGSTMEGIAERIRTEGRTTYEVSHRTKDGRKLNVDVHSALTKDSDGKITGYISSCRDITERKRVELELKKAHDELETRVEERTSELKQTSELLSAERQRFSDVLDQLPAYVILLTPDYHVAFDNRFFRERFGEHNGRKCHEYLFGRKEPCETCETYTVLRSNQPHHWEWTGPDQRSYDIYDFPFKDVDGSSLIMEVGLDITEMKRAQMALQMERKRLFDVLETLPVLICLLTPDYYVAWANRSFREKFGESGGRYCYEYCFGKSKPCEFCESYTVLSTGKPHHWEVKAPDGSVIDAYDFPFTDVDGSTLILEMGIDITEQKRMSEQLRSASLYSRSLLEASLDPLVTISPKGKITDVNEATLTVTGVAREQLIGTDFSNYFTEPERASEGYRQVFDKGFVTDYPLTIRHCTGQLTHVLYNATVYRDPDGAVSGVFAAARDITAKKAAEAELEKYRIHLEELVQLRTGELEKANLGLKNEVSLREKIAEDLKMSNRDLEQFAYVASHDLQEPLRAIGGFVELLKQQFGESLDAKKKEYMNFIVDGVARMQSLINGLLEYSRIETSGKEPAQVDAKVALDRALLNLQAAIKESGGNIAADILPRVYADLMQLAQLFQNLIGNAIKFRAAAAPEISVSASRDYGAWKFAVCDNGIGIEPQYSERIFQIFQRLHTRKIYPGTGIGLAICKRIVERHGGRIWVEPRPESGSIFYFTIPDH